jgi:hypothetical protein
MNGLRRLETERKIRLAGGRFGKFHAIKIRGKSASRTILEDRR